MDVEVADLAVVEVVIVEAFAAEIAAERREIGMLRTYDSTPSPRRLEEVSFGAASRIGLVPARSGLSTFCLDVSLAVESELNIMNVPAQAAVVGDEARVIVCRSDCADQVLS